MINFIVEWLQGVFNPLSLIEVACLFYILKNSFKFACWFFKKMFGGLIK